MAKCWHKHICRTSPPDSAWGASHPSWGCSLGPRFAPAWLSLLRRLAANLLRLGVVVVAVALGPLQKLLEQELVAGPSHELGLVALLGLGLVALVPPRARCAQVAGALTAVLQTQSSISEALALYLFSMHVNSTRKKSPGRDRNHTQG